MNLALMMLINDSITVFNRKESIDMPLQISDKKIHQNKRCRMRIQSTFSVHSVGSGITASLIGPTPLYCDAHSKKLEAFCDLEKKLLCIDCILNENHKTHEILSLEKASQKERQTFETSL